MTPRLLIITALAVVAACRRDAPEPRLIPAHTTIQQGVAHAQPAASPERYCSPCHGGTLAGGSHLQPSCYQCHGQNWSTPILTAEESPAPLSHTVGNRWGDRVYQHAPELFAPQTACAVSGCHGTALEGSTSHPSCELCHARLWETRTRDGS